MIKWLALIFLLIPGLLPAQEERAKAVAWAVLTGNQPSLKSGLSQDRILPVGDQQAPAAWVVTFQPAGFVIVSANPTGNPVLGFSENRSFPTDPGHPLNAWLLPAYARSSGVTTELKGAAGAMSYTDQSVQPLTSAQWGQGDPWNKYCPADETGRRALVGCVAVAMSQIMEKWQWPPQGYGEATYTPLQHPGYGEISVRFDTTRYRWDLTNDRYPTDAAALILYHTGAATFMNYDPELSSTSVDRFAIPALSGNFLYNKGMTFRDQASYAFPEWIRMLHQELDNDRPVLYAGTSPDGKSSHAFNIDGYRNDSWFHFNWGWNGAGDGWYTLIGMAGGGADFSDGQGAIFGLQPATLPLHDRPSFLEALQGDEFIQLHWDQPVTPDFSHFNVYRDEELISQTARNSYRDTAIANGQTHSYRVRASYLGASPGESAPTRPMTVAPWPRMTPGYMQGFELSPAGWQLKNSEEGFQTGPAADLGFGGNDGKIASIRSEGHAPGSQVSDFLISPVFYPADYDHPAISFDYVFRQNPGIDQLSLMWRSFDSPAWHLIAVLDSTGGYADWRNVHYYIPEAADGTPIQIAFHYNDSFGPGFGAAIDNIAVYEAGQPAVPFIGLDLTDQCIGWHVVITDLSTGNIHTWEWDFGEGAEPRYSSDPGPHQVTYTHSGAKTIKLSINHLDHLVCQDTILVRDKPVANFNYYKKAQEVTFVNKSLHAEQLLWIFGDGTTSTEADPIHQYRSKKVFEVRLIAYNGSCYPDTLLEYIDTRNGTGIEPSDFGEGFTLFPNPTQGQVTLKWNTIPHNTMTICVFSLKGQLVSHKEYPPSLEIPVDLSAFPDGLYILQLSSGSFQRRERIIKATN